MTVTSITESAATDAARESRLQPASTGAGVEHNVPKSGWLVVAFVYITMGSAVAPADVQLLGTSLVFIVILLVAVVGLRHLPRDNALTLYALGTIPLAVWVPVSAIAAWDADTGYRSLGLLVWLVAVPGIAAWFRLPSIRTTLAVGFTLNAAIFCGEIIRRVISTGTALDPSLRSVMGTNRNAVAAVFAFLVPLIAAGRRFRLLRFAGVVVLLVSIAALGSRSSLVAAVAALGLLLVLAGRRELLLVVPCGVLVLCFWLVAPSVFSDVVGFSAERFGSLRDERVLPDEELRGLLLRKALFLAKEHPIFGVGLGNAETTVSGVASQAQFEVNSQRADRFQLHNTFAEALAAFGFVGGVFYLIFALMPIWIGVRRRSKRVTRGPTAGYLALMIWSFYHSALGGNLLLLAAALVLGASMAVEDQASRI